jgi:hypothetical protein
MVAVYVWESVSGFISSTGTGFESTVTLPASIHEFFFDRATGGGTSYCLAPGDVVWDGSQSTNVPTVEMQDVGGIWRRFLSFSDLDGVPADGRKIGLAGDLGTFPQTVSFRIRGGGLPHSTPPIAGRTFTITMGFADICDFEAFNPPPVDVEGYAATTLFLSAMAGVAAAGAAGRSGRAGAQVVG